MVCWWGKIRFEDLGIDGRIILKWLLKKLFGRADWIDLVLG
jgi:hypothetical protein